MSEYFLKHISKQNYPVHPTTIKFWTQFKNCVLKALRKREWKETDDDDWDLCWAEKETVVELFNKVHLNPNQRVNHFRNHFEITRKDNMIKNLKRHKKALEKEGKFEEAASYDFFPTTYNLPSEYTIFCEEFKKTSNSIWIMKPIGKCQGKGIFLFKKLSQISDWKNDPKSDSQAENYIVQRYINNPLLIGGKKFDLRIYCLVTSFSPFVAYLYLDGFARFTHERYNNTDISNTCKYEKMNVVFTFTDVHLTNVAIQKHSDKYDKKIGGKWDLRTLKLYLSSTYGQDKVAQCFLGIQQLIIKTLQSVQKVIFNDKHCFELYGFDILIDANLKPWVLEVNGSPSMTANTKHDSDLKCGLLDDVFTIIDMEKILTGQEEQIGGFDLICKGNPIINENSLNPSMLGCLNNRDQQLEKLSKIIAAKLNQAQIAKEDAATAEARKASAKETMQPIPLSTSPDLDMSVRKTKSTGGTVVSKTPKNLFTVKQNVKPFSKVERETADSRGSSVSPQHNSRFQKGRTVELPPLNNNMSIPANSSTNSVVASAKTNISQRASSNIGNNVNSIINSTVSTSYSQNSGEVNLKLNGPQKLPHPPSLSASLSSDTIKAQYNTIGNTESSAQGNSSFIQLYEVFGAQQTLHKYNSTNERPSSIEKRFRKEILTASYPVKDSSPVVSIRKVIKEKQESEA